MEFVIEPLASQTQDRMIAFLQKSEDVSLFLLSNFAEFGPKLTEAAYSGNFKLAFVEGKLVSVFCLTKNGILLVTSGVKEPLFEPLLNACKEEGIPIEGVIGEWEFCAPFWNFLKDKEGIIESSMYTKHVLYTLNLQAVKNVSPQEQSEALTLKDAKEWVNLRKRYIAEEGLPNYLNDSEHFQEFERKASKGFVWGYFEEGELVSIAELNAQALDLGQVGGVYTLPKSRRKGYARKVMQQIIFDCKNKHRLRKLIIFTAEKNFSARALYASLGSSQVGSLATLFR